ncbi:MULTISPECIES: HEPN domain-containing protein [Sphingomonadales]|uniref:HEPN domain-containing protein n=1 Tax=Sphingomonadales TaxID=204457 RepID=UPI0001DD064F|nr:MULTISPECIES: HEPN domain-containing protein [Sphingomonadales]ALG60786.1 hypothetical protein WG74_08065 [Citromicrobium sp. JL477]KPM13316.1 hypothetical protein VO58_12280 [Citromicrobium sp. JL1351]KPM14870.1 hypothetical protein VM77_12975 [Citromicrobium sp. JL31]KPM22366.1 hypothetical protein VO57_13080 [Citromicrobium sp. JL2201]
MPQSQKRTELQKLSEAKLANAELLLRNSRFGDAFYLSGYAIELGLKAVIAKQMTAQSIPDKTFINAIYTHDLKKLVSLAGLMQDLQAEQKRSPAFATYWGIAGEWSESSRYFATDRGTAQLMVQSISDPNSGILRWIRQHW